MLNENYNPLNWYWVVNSKIYSSKYAKYIEPSDIEYQEFIKTNLPSSISSHNDLMYLLRKEHYPSLEEQLDMQYLDCVNGTHFWEEAIQKVKNTFKYETLV